MPGTTKRDERRAPDLMGCIALYGVLVAISLYVG